MSNEQSAPTWATRVTLLLALLLVVAFFLPWLSVSLNVGLGAIKVGTLSGWGLTTGRMSSVQLPDAVKQPDPEDPPAFKVLKQPRRYVSARPWYALALLSPLALLLLGVLHGRGRLSSRSWANTTIAAGLLGAALGLLAATVVIGGDLKSPPPPHNLLRMSTHASALLWCCVAGHLLVAAAGVWTRLAAHRSPEARPETPRRSTTARVLLASVGITALLLVSLLAYARWLLDPETFVVRTGSASSAALERASLGWHRGPKPCLRNRVHRASADAKSQAAAQDLVQAGFGEDVIAIVGAFAHWQARHEAAHHRHDAAEEFVRYLAKRAGVLDRMILWLARDRIVDSIRHKHNRTRARLHRQARKWLAQLSPARRRALRALWKRHPRQLSMPGLIHVHQFVSVAQTHRRADRLVQHLLAHAKRTGSLPEDLDDTVGESLAEHKRLQDGWYGRFEYTRTESGARITSYGADHEPGGDGINADIVRHLTAPATGTATAPEAGSPTGRQGAD